MTSLSRISPSISGSWATVYMERVAGVHWVALRSSAGKAEVSAKAANAGKFQVAPMSYLATPEPSQIDRVEIPMVSPKLSGQLVIRVLT